MLNVAYVKIRVIYHKIADSTQDGTIERDFLSMQEDGEEVKEDLS